MLFPPVSIDYPVPQQGEPGAFGAVRKHDVHTGIDLYCREGAIVSAIEDGVIVAIEHFTGPDVGSPWWHDTWAVLVEGASGVFVYGEIVYFSHRVGDKVEAGETVGQVTPVLKQYKGVTPTTMLHLELLKPGSTSTFWWHHGDAKPDNLLDPTEIVREMYGEP